MFFPVSDAGTKGTWNPLESNLFKVDGKIIKKIITKIIKKIIIIERSLYFLLFLLFLQWTNNSSLYEWRQHCRHGDQVRQNGGFAFSV